MNCCRDRYIQVSVYDYTLDLNSIWRHLKEDTMQTRIPVHEPFRKSWNEAQVIVTQKDIAEYENSKKQTCVPQTEAKNTSESQIKNRLNTNDMGDSDTSTEMLQRKFMDIQNLLLHSRMEEQRLQTPKTQCGYAEDSKLSPRSVMPTANSENFDRTIPNYSMSRSLPSSPVCGDLPITTLSPKMPSSPHGHFSFIPETVQFLEYLEQLQENDEVENGFRHSQGCLPQGKYRPHSPLHRAPFSPRRTLGSLYYESKMQLNDTQPLRAKRRLDMDDIYSTTVKRAKSDASHEAGLRYVSQLEMDLMSLKHRMKSTCPERVERQSNCVCSEMDKHFMEMATSAYKSIRRCDGTIRSFEQFKEELTKTNEVIKDSMELLQSVRRLCVH